MQKGVSARDMSLSIGQNPSYISNIEIRIFSAGMPKNPHNTSVFLRFFEHTDKKSDCTICANDLISISLNNMIRLVTKNY